MEEYKINKEIVSDQDLNNLLIDLDTYDKEHSSGAWLGRVLGGAILGGMKDEEGIKNLQDKINNNPTINDLTKKYFEILNKIGLELESPNKKGDYDENETYINGEIEINISNNNKFISFLRSIDEKNITDFQKKTLEMVFKKIAKQVLEEYSLKELDDRLLELFSGLREIITQSERLGLSGIKNFKDFLKYSSEQCLYEYKVARNKDLLSSKLKFYQRDITPQRYKEIWEENFRILKEIKNNPNAEGLYNDIVKYMKESLDFAYNDSKLDEYEKDNDNGYTKRIREAIKQIQDNFNSYLN